MAALKTNLTNGITNLTPGLSALGDARKAIRRQPRPRIGLALSSGGAKGLAHVGVIQVLEEHGVQIDAIAGCSMGAYVGACWAAGCDGYELEELAARMSSSKARMRLLDPIIPPRTGFVRGERIRRRLERTVGRRTFNELPRQLQVIATNLETYEERVFKDDSVVSDAVHASLAIPGICAPVVVEGESYVDGGCSNPLPVQQLLDMGMDRIIAVSVVPTVEELKACRLDAESMPVERGFWSSIGNFFNQHLNYFARGNILDILKRSSTGCQIRVAEINAAKVDLCLRPIVYTEGWQDYHNYHIYIAEGREVAEANIEKILGLIDESSTAPAESAPAGLQLTSTAA